MNKIAVFFVFLILFASYQSFGQVNPNSPFELYNDTPATKELTLQLTNGLPNDSLKALAIYNWIVENITYDSLLYAQNSNPLHWRNFEMPKDVRQIKPLNSCSEILSKKKAICIGYSYLFSAMCDLVGIKNAVIKGYARLDSVAVTTPNHAWVAFKLADKWYLADPTWDAAAYEEEADKSIAKGNHIFLMLDSELFLASHFPLDPLWQLRNSPVSLKKWNIFTDNANPSENYFSYADSLRQYETYSIEKRFLSSINRIIKTKEYAIIGHQEYCRFLFKPLYEDISYYDKLNRQLNNGNKSIQEMANKILPRKKELFDRLAKIESNIKIFRYHANKLTQIPDSFKDHFSEKDLAAGLVSLKRYNDYLISERASLEATIKELEPYQKKSPAKK